MPYKWETEPDRFEWIYKGYKCLILRHPEVKMLCGYIALPKNHACYGKSIDYKLTRNIGVHGGITYAGDEGCMGREKGVFYIGFDGGHAFDIIPTMYELMKKEPFPDSFPELNFVENYRSYKDMNYMRGQAEIVVEQVKEWTVGRLKYLKKCRNRRLLYDRVKAKGKARRNRGNVKSA